MPHARRLTGKLFVTVLAMTAGCSAGGGGAIPDAGPRDAVFELSLNIPDGCPPMTENNIGVGRACTMNGHECDSVQLQCSCDPIFGAVLLGIPCFCSRINFAQNVPDGGVPCDVAPANFCGASGASCCSYLQAGYYCMPNVCLDQGACPEIMSP